jgi:ERCC4-related helicase
MASFQKDEDGSNQQMFRLRSYQQEMLQESLKRNIIVAMDTGSGKTAIAVARAQLSLESSPPHKFVWFLAPTVPLCLQQHAEFTRRLPAYGCRTILGLDGCETWSDQATWDLVLKGFRIVISTHQVLLDALSHGFVELTRLALLVFDEAHHCTKRHPANQIMAGFYRHLLERGWRKELPAILGLSASPVINSKRVGLE